jgi:hypothetical protein
MKNIKELNKYFIMIIGGIVLIGITYAVYEGWLV